MYTIIVYDDTIKHKNITYVGSSERLTRALVDECNVKPSEMMK